jgi:hypothetical protein
MNPEEQSRWKSEVLDVVFEAMASSQALTSLLVYKGARVLNRRLRTSDRQSLDIDSNLTAHAAAAMDREEQMQVLRREIETALRVYFESETPVRYDLERVRAIPDPKLGKSHPMGWNAFNVKIQVRDLRRPSVRGLPGIEIDVAAPEALDEGSTAPLVIGDHEVIAYSVPRLAGEKLRAFLSSLPEYRMKLQKPNDAVRVKDIYDVGRIAREYPTEEEEAFWRQAGAEFRVACKSRYIDCDGISTFEQQLHVTRQLYETSPTLPKDISFDEAWGAVRLVVERFDAWDITPFTFPLPTRSRSRDFSR